MQAYHASWSNEFYRGAPATARAHADGGSALYVSDRHRSQALIYAGHDPGVCALVHAVIARWLLGYPDQASGQMADALALARRLDHPFSLALALDHAGRLHQFRRDASAVTALADTMLALAEGHRFAHLGAMGTFLRGWALAERGLGVAGLEAMHRGLAAYRGTGLRLVQPYLLSLPAATCNREGRRMDAVRLLDEAETQRIRGRCSRATNRGTGRRRMRSIARSTPLAARGRCRWNSGRRRA